MIMCRTSGCEDHRFAEDEEKHVLCLASQLSSYPYHHMAGLVARFKPAQGHACDIMFWKARSFSLEWCTYYLVFCLWRCCKELYVGQYQQLVKVISM